MIEITRKIRAHFSMAQLLAMIGESCQRNRGMPRAPIGL